MLGIVLGSPRLESIEWHSCIEIGNHNRTVATTELQRCLERSMPRVAFLACNINSTGGAALMTVLRNAKPSVAMEILLLNNAVGASALRVIVANGLTSSQAKAAAFAKAAAGGAFSGLDAATFEKLQAVLGKNDPSLTALKARTVTPAKQGYAEVALPDFANPAGFPSLSPR